MGKDKSGSPPPNTVVKAMKSMPDCVYEGELLNDKRHGFGCCKWTNGDLYEGMWRDDRRNGQGILSLAESKDKYEGHWRDGKADGYGIMTWAAGTRYEGIWKENKRQGQGTFHYADGTLYQGDWVDNKRHGRGLLTYPDSSIYVGKFSEDKVEGSGRYHPADLSLEKVWFETKPEDLPAQAIKDLKRRKLVSTGVVSPLLGLGGSPGGAGKANSIDSSPASHHAATTTVNVGINGAGLERNIVRSLLTQHVGDADDVERYLACLHERGFDNIVSLKTHVKTEADLRALGINKIVHSRKLLTALDKMEEGSIMPPPHPLLHHYLFALFEYESLEDEQLLTYIELFSERLGLTMQEELTIISDADIQSLSFLEGHKIALLHVRRALEEGGQQKPPIVVETRVVPAPVRRSSNGGPSSPVAKQGIVVGELVEMMAAMKAVKEAKKASATQGSSMGPPPSHAPPAPVIPKKTGTTTSPSASTSDGTATTTTTRTNPAAPGAWC